ncbi:myomegalin-like isoform X1 [Castor canadensis]|uniref:Myomegalin-like isoform X1 n=6 Tax=Castor canadensis TaxID=51338 RepID=A0AC58KNI8_CASCN
MVQALMERNSQLQALLQYLGGKDLMSQALISNQQGEVTSISLHIGEQTDQGSMQMPSRDDSTSLTAKEDASIPRSTLRDLDTVTGLEKELSNAKEELKLMAKKERESQDPQMQLGDPEDIQATECMTQEVLILQEKSCFSRIPGSRNFWKLKTTVAADVRRTCG